MKSRYLCCYDYGQGGGWCYMVANSAEEILQKYPELKIIDNQPDWFSEELKRNLEKNMNFNVEEKPSSFLASIIRNRK